MKRALVALVGAALAAAPVFANHAGCVASTAQPTCTYTAAGDAGWAAATPNAFEIWVTRDGEKVVLASRGANVAEPISGSFTAVGATPGEKVTVQIAPDAQGRVVGAVSVGMTDEHT